MRSVTQPYGSADEGRMISRDGARVDWLARRAHEFGIDEYRAAFVTLFVPTWFFTLDMEHADLDAACYGIITVYFALLH